MLTSCIFAQLVGVLLLFVFWFGFFFVGGWIMGFELKALFLLGRGLTT
jgi:hypothetical protein